MDFLGGISPEGVPDEPYLLFFLRMELSRWNLLGGIVQEKFLPDGISLFSSYCVEIP